MAKRRSKSSSSSRSKKNVLRGIAIFLAVLLVLGGVGVLSSWITGWTLTGEPNMSKWQHNSPKEDEGKNEDNVAPAGEGFLMFTPRTTASSPVALAVETRASETKSAKLTATIQPEGAFYKSVTWRSSSNALKVTGNDLQATVELVGTMTETATISCIVESLKTVTGTCTVDYIDLSNISFSIKDVEDEDPLVLAANHEYEIVPELGELVGTVSASEDFKLVPTFLEYRLTDYAKKMFVDTYFYDDENPDYPGNNWEFASDSYDFDEDDYSFYLCEPEIYTYPDDYDNSRFYKAFYYDENEAYTAQALSEIEVRIDVYYKGKLIKENCTIIRAFKYDPESYLTGVDGVEITPDGGIVFTD